MKSTEMKKGPTHPPGLPLKYKDMYMIGMASSLRLFSRIDYART